MSDLRRRGQLHRRGSDAKNGSVNCPRRDDLWASSSPKKNNLTRLAGCHSRSENSWPVLEKMQPRIFSFRMNAGAVSQELGATYPNGKDRSRALIFGNEVN